MEDIKVTGRLVFSKESGCEEYSRDFTATLTESGAFSYGNKTAVVIEWGQMVNGRTPEPKLLDTRYDTTIKRTQDGFREWLRNWFKENYNKHELIIH